MSVRVTNPHSPFRRLATWSLALISSWTLVVSAFAPSATADVIFQAFNERFRDIETNLDTLKQANYTWVQVSPPEKSNPTGEWYGRYQPYDYTVLDSPLGNESELKGLIDTAHARGMRIVVDVVFNQMTNDHQDFANLRYPFFSQNDFHTKACIDYGSRYSVTHGWLNCDLPDLATETAYVRQQAKNYLTKLLALGVDGFRFDAMKHIEPEFFRDVLAVVPAGIFKYGEYIAQEPGNSYEPHEYSDIGGLSVTDFWLLTTMLRAFGPGGDLRELADVKLVDAGKALPGTIAVTFATNHDIEKGQIGYRFADSQDTALAAAFVLARQDGFPLVYNGYFLDPTTRAGVAFHERMLREPQFFRNGGEVASGANSPNLLFIERGSSGLAILNKAGTFFDVARAKLPGLQAGCYRELHYGFSVVVAADKSVTRWGSPSRRGIQIGPRTALFLVQSADGCP